VVGTLSVSSKVVSGMPAMSWTEVAVMFPRFLCRALLSLNWRGLSNFTCE
jgi:hypothetical protein